MTLHDHPARECAAVVTALLAVQLFFGLHHLAAIWSLRRSRRAPGPRSGSARRR